jgi:ethanolamine utilization protein EutQ (cupin superfamily)
MHKVIKKSEVNERKVGETKSVLDYVTKEISPAVSFVVVKNAGDWGEVIAKYNRVYFVLEGDLQLKFPDSKEIVLEPGDACFVEKGEKFNFAGSCEVVTVDSPAHGS